jgi:hypothetical protein
MEGVQGVIAGLGYTGTVTWKEAVGVLVFMLTAWRFKRVPAEGRWLLGLGALIVLLSIVMARSIEGTLYSYLLFYLHCVPVLVVTALGTSFQSDSSRGTRWLPTVVAVLSGICIAVPLLWLNQPKQDCKGRLIAFAAEQTRSEETYLLVLHHSSRWPIAAGVVNELTREGTRVCVPANWRFAFRTPLVCTEEELQTARYRIHVSGRPKAPADTEIPVFIRKNYAVWVEDLGSMEAIAVR